MARGGQSKEEGPQPPAQILDDRRVNGKEPGTPHHHHCRTLIRMMCPFQKQRPGASPCLREGVSPGLASSSWHPLCPGLHQVLPGLSHPTVNALFLTDNKLNTKTVNYFHLRINHKRLTLPPSL